MSNVASSPIQPKKQENKKNSGGGVGGDKEVGGGEGVGQNLIKDEE